MSEKRTMKFWCPLIQAYVELKLTGESPNRSWQGVIAGSEVADTVLVSVSEDFSTIAYPNGYVPNGYVPNGYVPNGKYSLRAIQDTGGVKVVVSGKFDKAGLSDWFGSIGRWFA